MSDPDGAKSACAFGSAMIPKDSQTSQGVPKKRKARVCAGTQNAEGVVADPPKPPLRDFLFERINGECTLFELVQALRGYFPEALAADAAFEQVDKIMAGWGGWADYFGTGMDYDAVGTTDEAKVQFRRLWRRVRFRRDKDPMQQALEKATAHPLQTLRSEKDPMPRYDRFVSLCAWLQVTRGNKPIYLPQRRLAKALSAAPTLVHEWLQMAMEDGFLKCVKKFPFGVRSAREYAFDVSRWEVLRDHAAAGCESFFRDAESVKP